VRRRPRRRNELRSAPTNRYRWHGHSHTTIFLN
jgi:hypothetical protein